VCIMIGWTFFGPETHFGRIVMKLDDESEGKGDGTRS
jgi:hypothetical protein